MYCLARALYCNGVLRPICCACVCVCPCPRVHRVFAPLPPLKTTLMMYTFVLDNFIYNRIVNLTVILLHAPSIINRYFHVIYLSHGSNWYSHLCLHTYYIQ